jgi:hypothetical protein
MTIDPKTIELITMKKGEVMNTIKILDKMNDYIDDLVGEIEVGSCFYVKPTKQVVALINLKGPFMNVIELATGTTRVGINGYCYNANLVRLPLKADMKAIKQIIERYKKEATHKP